MAEPRDEFLPGTDHVSAPSAAMPPPRAGGITENVPGPLPESGGTNNTFVRKELREERAMSALIDQYENSTMRRGMKFPFVGVLQRFLGAVGLPVRVDNVFGAETESAVVAFQSDAGITADGIVGPETKVMLYEYMNGGRQVSVEMAVAAAMDAEAERTYEQAARKATGGMTMGQQVAAIGLGTVALAGAVIAYKKKRK